MYDKNKTQSRIIKVTNTSLVFHIETTVVEYTWCFCREANLFLSATSGSEHKLLNWPTLYLYAAKLSLNAKKMIDNLSSENNWSRLIQDRICVKVQKLLRTADRLPYLQIGFLMLDNNSLYVACFYYLKQGLSIFLIVR